MMRTVAIDEVASQWECLLVIRRLPALRIRRQNPKSKNDLEKWAPMSQGRTRIEGKWHRIIFHCREKIAGRPSTTFDWEICSTSQITSWKFWRAPQGTINAEAVCVIPTPLRSFSTVGGRIRMQVVIWYASGGGLCKRLSVRHCSVLLKPACPGIQHACTRTYLRYELL